MTGMTQSAAKILEHIARTVAERGYPPSVREIAEAVGLASTSRGAPSPDRTRARGPAGARPALPHVPCD